MGYTTLYYCAVNIFKIFSLNFSTAIYRDYYQPFILQMRKKGSRKSSYLPRPHIQKVTESGFRTMYLELGFGTRYFKVVNPCHFYCAMLGFEKWLGVRQTFIVRKGIHSLKKKKKANSRASGQVRRT